GVAGIGCAHYPFTPMPDGRQLVPAQDFRRLRKEVSSEVPFGNSPVAFFNGRLFASSRVGLLELDGARLVGIHRWAEGETGFEWIHATAEALWIHPFHPYRVIRFDGREWKTVPMPSAREIVTRKENLEGFHL